MSKYSGLPDIDTAPDVYETHPPERPEGVHDDAASDAASDTEPADTAIDRSSVNAAQAHAHFRAALPQGAEAAPGALACDTYELRGTAAEAESPLARLWRLQSEARELEAQLAQAQSKPRSAASMLKQIHALQQNLAHMDQSAQATDPWHVSHTMIDALGTSAATSASEAPAPSASRAYAPWEARVAALERRIGTDVADTRVPLLATVRQLEAQLALLAHPSHLDAVLARAKLLVSELQQADERRQTLASRTDEATLHKIEALYALHDKVAPLAPLVPALLTRLQTLAPVHAAAATFASRLEQVVHEQERMHRKQAELQSVLERVGTSLEENVATTQRNLAQLQARLDAIKPSTSPP
ncbi:hypothetical protein MCAP1_000515 [Malassezia caprae]|uniref:Dynactin subunit 2 n=1 Tax=Malassezia caprae TaxID=1381934 RepID=A0AAF0E505_9BASI|nr:hypothetical protein MCAP1_000515 [Malassezia caprae]